MSDMPRTRIPLSPEEVERRMPPHPCVLLAAEHPEPIRHPVKARIARVARRPARAVEDGRAATGEGTR